MAHLHDVLDDDPHFKIDDESREITLVSDKIPMLIQKDHNSERFTFDIPKLVDGHDMELCDKIRVHYINIEGINTDVTYRGLYEVDDFRTSPDDPSTMLFSWLINRDATTYVGTLNFVIEFICSNSDNIIDYAWRTGIYSGVIIAETIDNTDAIVGEYYDTLDQWLMTIEQEGNRVKTDVLGQIDQSRIDVLNRINSAAKQAEQSSLDRINERVEEVKEDLNIHGVSVGSSLLTDDLGNSRTKIISQYGVTNAIDGVRYDVDHELSRFKEEFDSDAEDLTDEIQTAYRDDMSRMHEELFGMIADLQLQHNTDVNALEESINSSYNDVINSLDDIKGSPLYSEIKIIPNVEIPLEYNKTYRIYAPTTRYSINSVYHDFFKVKVRTHYVLSDGQDYVVDVNTLLCMDGTLGDGMTNVYDYTYQTIDSPVSSSTMFKSHRSPDYVHIVPTEPYHRCERDAEGVLYLYSDDILLPDDCTNRIARGRARVDTDRYPGLEAAVAANTTRSYSTITVSDSSARVFEVLDPSEQQNQFVFSLQANGIDDIRKTDTQIVNGEIVNTHTIVLDDGTTKTFEVKDGVGITDIYRSGNEVTVSLNNGTTKTFEVKDGVSIRGISKHNTYVDNDGAIVTIYDIVLDDGTIDTFEVKDGVGIADITLDKRGDLVDTYAINLTSGASRYFSVPNNNTVGIRTSDSGASIHATDLIPLEHTIKAKVRSKNLIPYPYATNPGNKSGIDFSIDESDNGIVMNGTATANTSFDFVSRVKQNLRVEAGKKYRFTVWSDKLTSVTGYVYFQIYADGSNTANYVYSLVGGETHAFTLNYSGYANMGVVIKSGVTCDNDKVLIQITEGSEQHDYTPYVNVTDVKLTRCGKNLLKPVEWTQISENGLTFTRNNDGSITVNGTATALVVKTLVEDFHFVAGMPYTLSGCPSGGGVDTYRMDNTHNMADDGAGCTVTYAEDIVKPIRIRIASGASLDNLVFKPQLEVSDTATEFEKYVGTEYDIVSNGVPYYRVTSLTPTMNLLTNKPGVIIDATYNVDQTAAYNKINKLLETLLNGGA